MLLKLAIFSSGPVFHAEELGSTEDQEIAGNVHTVGTGHAVSTMGAKLLGFSIDTLQSTGHLFPLVVRHGNLARGCCLD